MYRVVLFDLDGTILDTVPDINNVLNCSLKHFSLPTISREQTGKYVGNGAYALVKRACNGQSEELIDTVYKHYSAAFEESKNELSSYYPGEEEALEKLSQAGVKLGIITNKPQKATQNVYEKFFKRWNFFFVQGQEEGVALKPSPEAVFKAIELAGAKKEECLFVGDGETDVQVAKNAGIDGISVLWGYRSRAQLEGAGATLFAETYAQLLRIIEEYKK